MIRVLPMYRADPADPLIYRSVHEGRVTLIRFRRSQAGVIDGIQVGPNLLVKRPFSQSLRFKILGVGASLLGLAGYLVGKKLLKRSAKIKPSTKDTKKI